MNEKVVFLSSFLLAGIYSLLGNTIPFSAKLSENGINFHGTARFDFQIIDSQNNIIWIPVADANTRDLCFPLREHTASHDSGA